MVDGKQEQIMALYEYAGRIDMGIAVASFRVSLPYYCKPCILSKHLEGVVDGNSRGLLTCSEAIGLDVKGLAHPLIRDAVPNDFELKERALITGANASGKSTFMKALAINVILAQTIHTCTAKEFSMPPVSVITSMSPRDDWE